MTLGERFVSLKGVGPAFDHMRIGLSLVLAYPVKTYTH